MGLKHSSLLFSWLRASMFQDGLHSRLDASSFPAIQKSVCHWKRFIYCRHYCVDLAAIDFVLLPSVLLFITWWRFYVRIYFDMWIGTQQLLRVCFMCMYEWCPRSLHRLIQGWVRTHVYLILLFSGILFVLSTMLL